jgi:hypothetical protein
MAKQWIYQMGTSALFGRASTRISSMKSYHKIMILMKASTNLLLRILFTFILGFFRFLRASFVANLVAATKATSGSEAMIRIHRRKQGQYLRLG